VISSLLLPISGSKSGLRMPCFSQIRSVSFSNRDSSAGLRPGTSGRSQFVDHGPSPRTVWTDKQPGTDLPVEALVRAPSMTSDMTGEIPSTQFEGKDHDLRMRILPLRAGAQAGAAVAVRDRDAADLEKQASARPILGPR